MFGAGMFGKPEGCPSRSERISCRPEQSEAPVPASGEFQQNIFYQSKTRFQRISSSRNSAAKTRQQSQLDTFYLNDFP